MQVVVIVPILVQHVSECYRYACHGGRWMVDCPLRGGCVDAIERVDYRLWHSPTMLKYERVQERCIPLHST